MTDIGAVTPSIEADDAALGMLAELTHELRSAPSLSRRFGEQDDGAVQADGQHVVIGGERFEGRSVLDVSAETANAGNDRLTGLGVPPQFARQCQQPARPCRDPRRLAPA